MVRRSPLYPRNDADDRESQPNGAVLATRSIQAAALTLVPTLSFHSYQILYKTSDQNDRPLATVTTVFVPLLADKSKLLSFAVAEDSGAQKCAPSYQYR